VLGDWNAGGWFADAVEAYNSGQRPSAKGQVSPWAMLLACAGLPLFAGSASRRLGARTQARAAFPFVTEGAAPTAEGEAGRIEAEIWAPVWERPMTLAELRALLLRGRAEVGGRGAATPAAFAAAAVRRGVDAGIREFRRFTLIHTTSAQTFEPRLATVVPVPRATPGALGETLEAIADLRDRLPRDEKRGKRWIFRGLRGPLDASLVDFASDLDDPEKLRAMLDAVTDALTRVDRNRSYRKAHTSFRLLPPAALLPLFEGEPPGVEVRIAIALASLRATPPVPPFVAHVWGVDVIDTQQRAVFRETAPAQRVCVHGDLDRDLAAVVRRRLVDANPGDCAPFAGSVRARLSDAARFLAGSVDDVLLGRWIRRAALFDWSSPPGSMRLVLHSAQSELPEVDGPLALYALLKPLFEPWNVRAPDEQPLIEPRARRVPALARIAALLEAGSIDRAVDEAFVRYRMSARAPAVIRARLDTDRPLRLLAALAIPVAPQIGRIAVRWLRPQPE
jgi:CRISPR-associated protein Csx17